MEDHKKALLIVDMQYDFIPGGSLEVKGGDEIIQPINKLREKSWDLVVLTQDWHPDNHFSFHSNNPGSSLFQPFYVKDHDVTQVMWPNHCVQNTSGAELHKDLIVKDTDSRVKKGQIRYNESYSGFGSGCEDTGLRNILIANKIKKVYVVGLAFDYCVGNTALDALKHGHETYVLMDCTRSVASDSEKEMKTKLEQAGCKFITSEDLDKYIQQQYQSLSQES